MSDKLSGKLDDDVHHNEKHQAHNTQGVDLSETAGRRASVALNIVENPLQVSFRLFGLARSAPLSCFRRQLMLVFSPEKISTANRCRC
jgi:hypothetical protein